ncbi:MAG: hypothetical protein PHS82_16560 [Lachnospiraceae bacterium]|nr:hypothetical protein [Lachnospiraceae bacterium]
MNCQLKRIMECIEGSVVCVLDSQRSEYQSGSELLASLEGKYVLTSIAAEDSKVVVTVKLDTTIPNDLNADWVKEHVAQYGKEPEFF